MDETTAAAIRSIAAKIAENYSRSEVPLYGKALRLPDRKEIIDIIHTFEQTFFPAYYGDKTLVKLPPEQYSALLLEQIYDKLVLQISLALEDGESDRAHRICGQFFDRLPWIQQMLQKDLYACFEGDPAASSKAEIIFSYPGFFAIFVYRLAHELYQLQVPMIPRIMTEYAHGETGIDINPGASIGEYFFIDHGTGIVVGETTVIGDHVNIYQSVTLGALSPRSGHDSVAGRRHPLVGSNVTIYAGATILGGETRIGDNTVIGGNTFITDSVAEDTRVTIKHPEMRFRDAKDSND